MLIRVTTRISGPGQLAKGRRQQPVADRLKHLAKAGIIAAVAESKISDARVRRNDIAHRADVTLEAADICASTLQALIELVCDRRV